MVSYFFSFCPAGWKKMKSCQSDLPLITFGMCILILNDYCVIQNCLSSNCFFFFF